MEPAVIADLLEPFLDPTSGQGLSAVDLQNISTYIDILLRWNARINLTAIRDSEQIVARHFGESLFAARHLFPVRGVVGATGLDRVRLADVGSGAGFPGVPIKLWAADIALTLIESSHKKGAFLGEIARALRLTSVDIRTERAESVVGQQFDIVTLRAVEHFETVLPIVAALLAPSGRLVLLVGEAQVPKARAILERSVNGGSIKWFEPVPIPQSRQRVLAIATRNQEG